MISDDTLTIEKIEEAMALIKALAPKEAPKNMFLIKGHSGLNIVKNETLPNDTIIVSKQLFDIIFESSEKIT